MKMKCPACGFSDQGNYNPQKRIVVLLSERSKKTQKILRNVIRLIRNIPSENTKIKQFYFLQGISNISEDIIQLVVHKYVQDERHTQGKGFPYLQKMIQQMNTDKEKLLELEIKKHGRTPSKKKVKRKEYNNVYSRNNSDTVSR
jgi:hypothetical protein